METYRLNSTLVDNNKEYIINTSNDVSGGVVASTVYINGALADEIQVPHPEKIEPEVVFSLVKTTHGERKKEVETLLKAYKQARESGSSDMLYHLGLAFFYRRFYTEAFELFEGALNLNKEYHEAAFYLGQTALAQGDTEKAVAFGLKAVDSRPEYADYRSHLGEAYLARREYARAIREFEKAIGINLYYSDAYFNCALALLAKCIDEAGVSAGEQVPRAIEMLKKAALIYPDYKTSHFQRGLELIKAAELREGLSVLEIVRRGKQENHRQKYAPYYMKYALYPQWITEKVVTDRIEFLQNEITRNPTYVDLYAELSRCYLQHSRLIWKRGIDQYRKTLDINPALTRIGGYIADAQQALETMDGVIKKSTQQS